MATYQRDGVTIVSGVEELAAGRYRGMLTINTDGGQWQHSCPKCRGTQMEAGVDADAEIEFAYRRYLASLHGQQAPRVLN